MRLWKTGNALRLRKLLVSQVSQKGICVFPLDSSCGAHPLIKDHPLPWQKAQTRPKPQQVRQSLEAMLRLRSAHVFLQIGTPAQPPKPRGKSPGEPKGKPKTRKERCQGKKGAFGCPNRLKFDW